MCGLSDQIWLIGNSDISRRNSALCSKSRRVRGVSEANNWFTLRKLPRRYAKLVQGRHARVGGIERINTGDPKDQASSPPSIKRQPNHDFVLHQASPASCHPLAPALQPHQAFSIQPCAFLRRRAFVQLVHRVTNSFATIFIFGVYSLSVISIAFLR